MIAKAKEKYIRISPQKLRLVIALIKGLPVTRAQAILKSVNKKGALLLNKAISSASANAKNKGFDEKTLFISRLVANSGPVLKRLRAASFGRATTIRKRTSHIVVELGTKDKMIKEIKK